MCRIEATVMLATMPVTETDDTVTGRGDATSASTSGGGVRLRLPVYDALAAQRGLTTVEAQADFHGLHRATMHALRGGRNTPSLPTAMRIAADLGVAVEALFERVAP